MGLSMLFVGRSVVSCVCGWVCGDGKDKKKRKLEDGRFP